MKKDRFLSLDYDDHESENVRYFGAVSVLKPHKLAWLLQRNDIAFTRLPDQSFYDRKTRSDYEVLSYLYEESDLDRSLKLIYNKSSIGPLVKFNTAFDYFIEARNYDEDLLLELHSRLQKIGEASFYVLGSDAAEEIRKKLAV